jgi:hypothetical protein
MASSSNFPDPQTIFLVMLETAVRAETRELALIDGELFLLG